MADGDPIAPREETDSFAAETESRLDCATAALNDVTNALSAIYRLTIMAESECSNDREALLTAIRDMARSNARRLDRCAAIIGGGPAVGCFADDLGSE